jgi:hypothetical protein
MVEGPHRRDSANDCGDSVCRAVCFFCTSFLFGIFVTAALPLQAEESDTNVNAIVTVIDKRIRDEWQTSGITPAEKCTDTVFVRRLYLDLAGRVPTVSELQTWLADETSDKPENLVDLLLNSEDHVQHFADTFDTLLMGRGQSSDYDQRRKHQWRAWLERVFRENRPWNKVIEDLLLARPESDSDQGAVWFLYERTNNHQEIAEAIAPAFFGVRIECAQCHDHMGAAEIKQSHYWGLVAFFSRGTNTNTKNGPRVGESAIGGFSDFANLEGSSTPNLLTFFDVETIDEPRPDKDEKQDDSEELYSLASRDGDPRVPKFSRRQQFADTVTANHPLIARAAVNRIWAMLMGRGIVHPFDEMDSMHDPSHPELLHSLAENFRMSNYDMRKLVRSIALSRPYRLSSRAPEQATDPASFAWYLERPLTAEQLARSIQLTIRGKFQNDSLLVDRIRQRIPDVLPDENITTVKDAMFLTNSEALNGIISNNDDPAHLVTRLAGLASHGDRVDLLFLTFYGRQAADDERSKIIDYLGRDKLTRQRIEQVIWSMAASAEFRFNH